MNREGMDRREFFGRVALVAGGIAVSLALPWPAARALARTAAAASSRDAPSAVAAVADWSIDDQWAPTPRCADPIGYGRPAAPRAAIGGASGPSLAAVGSIDALLYV
jgi:hypothetical protein